MGSRADERARAEHRGRTVERFSRDLCHRWHAPHVAAWWPRDHIIGYEHSFTHTVRDFLPGIVDAKSPRPDFEDGVRNQRVLDAIEKSATTRQWTRVA